MTKNQLCLSCCSLIQTTIINLQCKHSIGQTGQNSTVYCIYKNIRENCFICIPQPWHCVCLLSQYTVLQLQWWTMNGTDKYSCYPSELSQGNNYNQIIFKSNIFVWVTVHITNQSWRNLGLEFRLINTLHVGIGWHCCCNLLSQIEYVWESMASSQFHFFFIITNDLPIIRSSFW